MMKRLGIKRTLMDYKLISFALLIGLIGCAGEELSFERVSKSDPSGNIVDEIGDDGSTGVFEHPEVDGEDNDGGGEGDLQCASGDPKTESFSLTPDSVRGANIIFLIDDSGSMADEFSKVAANLESFAEGVSNDAEGNYRILFLYKDFRLRGINPAVADSLQNIFTTNPSISHADSITWSKWADIGFFKAFAKADYVQNYPSPLPADDPFDIDGNQLAPVQTAGDCGPNDFFRPRQVPWLLPNFNNTLACHARAPTIYFELESFLLPDIAINMVAISDDDLNVAWNRGVAGEYPRVSDLMFKQVFQASNMNSNYIYHSIVGFDRDAPGVDEVGASHIALSEKTSGATFDITQEDWSDLFAQLQQKVIYSEQRTDLACQPAIPSVIVRLNGVELEPSTYVVKVEEKQIQLLPEAFQGVPEGSTVSIQVEYNVL